MTRPGQWHFWTGTLNAKACVRSNSASRTLFLHVTALVVQFSNDVLFVTLQHSGHGDIRDDKMARFAIVTESDTDSVISRVTQPQ